MAYRESTLEMAFQSCLKAVEAGEALEDVLARYPKQAASLRPELEAALWLRRHRPAVGSRPGFLQASRRRLEEQVRAEQAYRPQPWLAAAGRLARWPWSFHSAFQAVVLVVFFFSLFSVYQRASISARIALPGDALYPLKLFNQQARLAFTFNRQERVGLEIDYLQQRGYEIQGLILEGRAESLSSSVLAYVNFIERTRQDLDRFTARDPHRFAELNGRWQQAVTELSNVLPLYIGMLPVETRSAVSPVLMLAH